MGKSCTILAHVRNPQGEVVESRLFNDLLHYTSGDRKLTKEFYAVGTNSEFLQAAREKKEFEVDENGEITFRSLRTLSGMDIETDKVLKVLNEDIGEGVYSYNEAIQKIERFNSTSPYADTMLATMVKLEGDKYYVSVIPETRRVTDMQGEERQVTSEQPKERRKLYKLVRDKSIERGVISLLRRHHVSVDFITNAEQEGGRYTTENATKMENGLFGLIEVNETGHVTDVLAEEAGHFAFGALQDHVLSERLLNMLQDEETRIAAVGEKEYNESMLGTNPAKEIAGRLVGKALQRRLGKDAPFKVLANRIANIARKVFYNLLGNEVRLIAIKAEQEADRIAYQFITGKNNFSVEHAISIPETMRHSAFSINQKVFKKVADEFGRMCKAMNAISSKGFSDDLMSSLVLVAQAGTNERTGTSALQMEPNMIADTFAFDGIVQALLQIQGYISPDGEVEQLMRAVSLSNPSEFYEKMAANGRNLRMARTFLNSAACSLKLINDAIKGGNLTLPNGADIHNITYQDVDGNWKTLDLDDMMNHAITLIASLTSELHGLEHAYFARFCEDIYGSKYISYSTGAIWSDISKGQVQDKEVIVNFSELIDGNSMDDIDVFHKYIGSMANNPDIIGQIADIAVKRANRTANEMTAELQERLFILQERANKLGINMEDLIEKDDEGNYTGNIITPPAEPSDDREESAIYNAYMEELGESPAVNHGIWEKRREEYMKSLWETFKRDHPDWNKMAGVTRGYEWERFRRKKMKEWNKKNSIRVQVLDPVTNEVDYIRWVPNGIYKSNAWSELKDKYASAAKEGDHILRWVSDYMKIKRQMDDLLPFGTTSHHRLPQFRGTLGNALRNARAMNPEHKLRTKAKVSTRRVILETFVETSEDEDYGDFHTMNHPDDEMFGTRLNYEEERALRLPIFGIRKLKHMEDLSTDLIGSMTAYVSMATSYAALDNVVDALEVGRQTLYERDIKGRKGEEGRLEKRYDALKNWIRKKSGVHGIFEYGTKDRAYCRYCKYLEAQVYGITAPPIGFTIKGQRVLLNKIIKFCTSLGGAVFLAGNVLGGMVNTGTGFFNIAKEALAGEHYTMKDLVWAHKVYFKHFIPMWLGYGKLRKENKLSMFIDEVDAQASMRTKFRNWHTNRNRWNNGLRSFWYLPYSAGDHYMQAMSYLAVAHRLKLHQTDGSSFKNLWDSYSQEPIINTDENKSKTQKLSFDGNIPRSSKEITTALINSGNLRLRDPERDETTFREWLVANYPDFLDEGYKKDHEEEYNNLRNSFYEMSDEALLDYSINRYNTLTGLIKKAERAISSPLFSSPSFTEEEERYLRSKRLGTGEFKDILRITQNDVYNMIWSNLEMSKYINKCRELNNRLHGIYNTADKTELHTMMFWNAFLAMKGWALGNLEMMYSPEHYSLVLGKNVEGFVQTALKIPMSKFMTYRAEKRKNYLERKVDAGEASFDEQMKYEEMKDLDFTRLSFLDIVSTMVYPWTERTRKALREANFNDTQVYNTKRMAISVYLMSILAITRFLLTPPPEKEDADQSILKGLLYYLSMRTMFEQEALLYAPEAYAQSGSLLNVCPVGITAVGEIIRVLYLGIGSNFARHDNSTFFYQKNDPNGKYDAGDPKWQVAAIRLIPYVKSMWGLLHPYAAADSYEYGRKLKNR